MPAGSQPCTPALRPQCIYSASSTAVPECLPSLVPASRGDCEGGLMFVRHMENAIAIYVQSSVTLSAWRGRKGLWFKSSAGTREIWVVFPALPQTPEPLCLQSPFVQWG